MNKYLAIIDTKTIVLSGVCVLFTWLCLNFGIAYDLNVTLFSIAVIFPLVFTIREAFKRRDNALKFLSRFKAAMGSVHYSFEQCKKLDASAQEEVTALLHTVSELFFQALASRDSDNSAAEHAVDEILRFIKRNNKEISSGLALKIIRFVQDVNDGMENTISLKMHGTPISMRAYCLVFVFLFPVVFAPTIAFHLPDAPALLTYGLSVLHGFILISLYNVQQEMENPFDQIGLDDIKLDEYRFQAVEDRYKAINTAGATAVDGATETA